jgi:predicted metalloprotease with PDZ domain
MIKYNITYQKPHNRFIHIECEINDIQSDKIQIHIPVWRPGRYELGNFSKNIKSWKANDENRNELCFKKLNHSSWEVETLQSKSILITYNYYAAELNAGSSFIDDDFLYVNPVNCLVYVKEKMNEECMLNLKLPENYQVATALNAASKFSFKAKNFDHLADSPFIAGIDLQHDAYAVNDVVFHVWFRGECKPDWDRIKSDFTKFSSEQIKTMNGFPVSEYHFLFHILSYKYYHGVEHANSTVIVMGPSYDLMKKKLYDEFLGVSSHELFHAWNIKTIRPVEMFPYDFSRENYSRMGYVAEGITTYYGDLFLFRSGVFSEPDYFNNLNISLQRHFDNYGRFNYSVAESSFDTWLDGYASGIPDRKVSIYTEGCLCAFMADVLIRQASDNKKSLDDVMRILYHEFALKEKAYSETDYKNLLEKVSGISFSDFFEKYLYGTHDYESLLKFCFDYLGLELQQIPSKNYCEQFFGFKTGFADGKLKVSSVAPFSPAYVSSLLKDDEILAANSNKLNNNLNEWCEYYNDNIMLTVIRQEKILKLKLVKNQNSYYPQIIVQKSKNTSKQQDMAYHKWRFSR